MGLEFAKVCNILTPLMKMRQGMSVAFFGIFGHPKAADLTYLDYAPLQHRGQESSGIVTSDDYSFSSYRNMGLVENVFDAETLAKLTGHIAVGHNRYSTAGASHLANTQPLTCEYKHGPLAIAHNGNLVNAQRIRTELENRGAIFSSTSDTEVIAHLIARSEQSTLQDRILDALRGIDGAYSLVFMGKSTLIGVRDPYGFSTALVRTRWRCLYPLF